MKKLLLSIILLVGVLSGCNQSEEQQIQEINQAATIIVSINHNEDVVSKVEVEFEQGQNVLEVLKENFDVVETDGFVQGIGEVVADESKQEFLAFSVNGEMALKGAAETEVQNGDTITFDLQTWE